MKIILFLLLSINLFGKNCKELSDDLYYHIWVLNHHIEYNHKYDIKSSKKKALEAIDLFEQNKCSEKDSGFDNLKKLKKRIKDI